MASVSFTTRPKTSSPMVKAGRSRSIGGMPRRRRGPPSAPSGVTLFALGGFVVALGPSFGTRIGSFAGGRAVVRGSVLLLAATTPLLGRRLRTGRRLRFGRRPVGNGVAGVVSRLFSLAGCGRARGRRLVDRSRGRRRRRVIRLGRGQRRRRDRHDLGRRLAVGDGLGFGRRARLRRGRRIRFGSRRRRVFRAANADPNRRDLRAANSDPNRHRARGNQPTSRPNRDHREFRRCSCRALESAER